MHPYYNEGRANLFLLPHFLAIIELAFKLLIPLILISTKHKLTKISPIPKPTIPSVGSVQHVALATNWFGCQYREDSCLVSTSKEGNICGLTLITNWEQSIWNVSLRPLTLHHSPRCLPVRAWNSGRFPRLLQYLLAFAIHWMTAFPAAHSGLHGLDLCIFFSLLAVCRLRDNGFEISGPKCPFEVLKTIGEEIFTAVTLARFTLKNQHI